MGLYCFPARIMETLCIAYTGYPIRKRGGTVGDCISIYPALRGILNLMDTRLCGEVPVYIKCGIDDWLMVKL